LDSSLQKQWKEAMRQEYASLIENSTFISVTNTNGMKPIGCRWVHKTKNNPNGTVRYKARLMIKGYEQIRGVNFDETYAPVGMLITLRYLLSFAAQNNYKIDHLDVVTAFLNPEINTEVYMQLPEGIEWLEPIAMLSSNRDHFLRLNKVLYGLQQAPRLWHQEIDGFLQSIRFHRSHADVSLYIRNDGVLILLYVDDILVFYADEASEKALEVKQRLMLQYKMSNLGPAKQFLGLEIDRLADGTITLSQPGYISTILTHFNMQDANPAPAPLHPKNRLDIDASEADEEVDPAEYQSIVGSLMYAAIGTRPDIAFAVAALSRSNIKPYRIHLTAAKRVLRYLKVTANAKLVVPSTTSTDESPLVEYTDSDFAGDRADRKSQGSYIFKAHGAPISWLSLKQGLGAFSTTEAEYIACSDATREAEWLVQLHKDVTDETAVPTIYCDSNGALKTIYSGVSSPKTKHINIRYQVSRDRQERGIVNFTDISTDDNLVNIMSKALGPDKRQHFATGIGLCSKT